MAATLAPQPLAPYVVVVPARLAPVRRRPLVYVRRRVLVSLTLVAVVAAVWLGAGTVLANRGGDPASASTVRPALAPAQVYTAQPGDTMWSIAERFHGSQPTTAYVDELIGLNGGAALVVGQAITLP